LPALIDFYELYSEHRDKFEILAFHDDRVKNFAELDEKLAVIKAKFWGGKDLPFPILLDSTGSTLKEFGIFSFPTILLIDPDGKLVGEAFGPHDLEEKLPPVPMSKRLPLALDRQVASNVDDNTLSEAVERLAGTAHVPIRLDEEALKSAGVAPNDRVPLKLAGRLSLRSWLNLVLEAHGLTFSSGIDGLIIASRAAGQVPPPQDSAPQRSCLERIEARLRMETSFDFRDQTLAAIAAHFEQETGENFILDPTARKHGRLDPNAQITGAAENKPLGEALTLLLRSSGLTFVIRDELVVVTPLPTSAKD
jgi:hypothetical protein